MSTQTMIAPSARPRTIPTRPVLRPAPESPRRPARNPGDGRFRAVADRLNASLQIAPGERVMDLSAADAVGADGSAMEFPFPDASFDVVIAPFAAALGADHRRVADELLRICRPGGRIGLACWMPAGFEGELMSIVAAHSEAADGEVLRLSDRYYLNSLFGERADALGASVQVHTWRYRSIDEWLTAWRLPGQPLYRVYLTTDTERRERLSLALLALAGRFNEAGDGSMVVPSEYLEFLVHKKAPRT